MGSSLEREKGAELGMLLAISDFVAEVDAHGLILAAVINHDVFPDLLSEQLVNKSIAELPPAIVAESQLLINRCFATQQKCFAEVSLPTGMCELRTYPSKTDPKSLYLTATVFPLSSANTEPTEIVYTKSADQDGSTAPMVPLKYTVNLLTTLIENLQEAIIVTDNADKIIYVNETYCTLFNYKCTPKELTGINILENPIENQIGVQNVDDFVARLVEIVRNREIVIADEFMLVDGTVIRRDYIPVDLGPIGLGQIWKYLDITEQKNSSLKFERQRKFYEDILNYVSADIAVLDSNFAYTFVNPAAVKAADLRTWLIGKTDRDYCLAKGASISLAEKRWEMYSFAIEQKTDVEWEETIEASNGELINNVRRIHPVFAADGTPTLLIGYGLNITERLHAERSLQLSRDTFASVFDNSGIGIVLCKPNGAVVDANNALCSLSGYSKDELQLLSFTELQLSDDVNNDKVQGLWVQQNKLNSYTVDKRIKSRDHQLISTSVTVSVVRNQDSSIKFLIYQIIDITEKKNLESELLRNNAHLEAVQISLTDKLNQLEQLNHIIGHNLRGHASNIKMFVDRIAIDDSAADTSDEIFTREEAVEFLRQSTASLSENLENMIEISQIKLNTSIRFDDCDIASILKDVCLQLQGNIFATQAIIETALEQSHISYPRVYLESILYNFLSNALKYRHPARQPKILVSTYLVDGKTHISVKDNGIGIDLYKYGHKMFKLNGIFHTGYDSKGIGLFMTKTQVEMLGGKIHVNSKVDEGSEFIVVVS